MVTVSTATLGSNPGTGGMETKLIAAEIATAAGLSTIITCSRHPASLFAILEYHSATSDSGHRTKYLYEDDPPCASGKAQKGCRHND